MEKTMKSSYHSSSSSIGRRCSSSIIPVLLGLQLLSWAFSASLFPVSSSFVIIPTILAPTFQLPTKRKDRSTEIKPISSIPQLNLSTERFSFTLDYGSNIHHNNRNNRNNNKSKPYLEIIHPQTNTTVILIGCLHGSSSSAKDVSDILNESLTDAIVLELCPTRYKDLIKFMTKKKRSLEQTSSRSTTNNDNNVSNSQMSNMDEDEMNPVIGQDYINMISKTIQYNGISTGIAAAILGGASGLSSTFSGFEAGLEFTTAIEYVQNYDHFFHNYHNNNDNRNTLNQQSTCDIILGDQLVDETLKRVGSLPKISLDMWNGFIQTSNWAETYGRDATILSDAIEGDKTLKNHGLQIELARVFFRNKDVIVDLFRLLLPTFVFIQMFAVITKFIGGSSYVIDNAMVDLAPTFTRTNLVCDIGLEILTSASIIFVGYIALVLPSVRVILSERDYQLANAIHAACYLAREKYNESNADSTITSNRRVVAILGLLHVNGVAKRLVSAYGKERM